MSVQIDDSSFKSALAGLIPHLRAFARSLCGNAALADDLAQDAMLKAWKSRASFETGSNMKAWTFTILRNLFYSEKRRSWRRQPLDPEVAEATLVANDDPSSSMELLAVRNALSQLPDDQREALVLATAGGLPYEDIAEICGCAVGTIKSRVSRARIALMTIIETSDTSFVANSDLRSHEAFDSIVNEADMLASRT